MALMESKICCLPDIGSLLCSEVYTERSEELLAAAFRPRVGRARITVPKMKKAGEESPAVEAQLSTHVTIHGLLRLRQAKLSEGTGSVSGQPVIRAPF